ncbi:serine/threonine protein phosphatase 1 [Sphingopyxis sp. YR583]|nr:serine/threonine protein phosphatase 1 [Sphingopyxis sp. YR583]
MFRSLFRNKKPDTHSVRPPVLPEGMRVYAIGDIHGRDDLFAELLDLIEADKAARPGADCALILLGDLVDRGPSSAAVIDRAIVQRDRWSAFHWLTGNHEEVFVKALTGDLSALKFFSRIGGEETILSYGIDEANYARMTYEELSVALIAAVPAAHREFLAAGEELIILGDYVFVHAGVRPGVSLKSQKPADLRWIREPFLSAGEDFGGFVVHGHTITSTVDERPNRLGIDTGAYASGKLTAAAFEGAERWYLSTGQ